ncbi:hypothetical protein BV25DRAFT_1830826 [Artomyces pyxidatus]|uniref:Uncharacterized protein n=1 Tax=Artomyces pyxidatus TaxID=48021 RepID=A0ACB8SPQ5_9AGAM|nr:hypothetical protein BV25DRAFT_1830826 [Artomyces pyxidatus]
MAKIVLVTLLAPEWVLAWAVRQFMRARSLGVELEAARADARWAWEQHGQVKRVRVDEAGGAGGGDEQDDMIPLTRQTRPLAEAQRQADALYDDGKPEKSTCELVGTASRRTSCLTA